MNLRLGVAVVVVVGGVLAWGAYGYFLGGVPVETAEVRVGPMREYVDEQGQTRLPRTYLITMPYDGRIRPIDLEEGEPVKKDQVVARVDAADLDGRVAEAEAAVARLE